MRAVIIALGLLALAGCATLSVTKMAAKAAPRDNGCALDIFTDASTLSRPHDDLCLIDSRTAGPVWTDRSLTGAINQARPAACECGADALVVLTVGQQPENGSTTAVLRAIKYR
jgi:hypothetical protein